MYIIVTLANSQIKTASPVIFMKGYFRVHAIACQHRYTPELDFNEKDVPVIIEGKASDIQEITTVEF